MGRPSGKILRLLFIEMTESRGGIIVSNAGRQVISDLTGWKWQALVPDNADAEGGDQGSNTWGGSSTGDRTYTAGHFQLDIDGKSAGIIKKIEGGEIKADVIDEHPNPTSMELLP